MSDRITGRDVSRMAVRVAYMMVEHGMIPANCTLAVQEGSRTYGRAWRVFVTGGDYGTGYHTTPVGDLASDSARGLWEKLHVVQSTLYAVAAVTA